jgi:hypothetical protein
MQVGGSREQQLIFLNTHWGSMYEFGGPGESRRAVDGHRALRPARRVTRGAGRRASWPGAQVDRVVYCTARIDGVSNPSGQAVLPIPAALQIRRNERRTLAASSAPPSWVVKTRPFSCHGPAESARSLS